MTLSAFSNGTHTLSFTELLRKSNDNLVHEELVKNVQSALTNLGGELVGLLDPGMERFGLDSYRPKAEPDGILGRESRNALKSYGNMVGIQIGNELTPQIARALISPNPAVFPPLKVQPSAADTPEQAFAKRILRHMMAKKYWIARHPDMLNIVYVEDAAMDGTPLPNTDDAWNDRRILIRILADGSPDMVLNVEATTEPNKAYAKQCIDNQALQNHPDPNMRRSFDPDLPKAAARIAFGQYKAWEMGWHNWGRRSQQPALHQEMPVLVFRDKDASGTRNKGIDDIEEGVYFINQHSTSRSFRRNKVGPWSRGCLVGRFFSEHERFLALLKTDVRYVNNPLYRFITAVLNGDEVAATN